MGSIQSRQAAVGYQTANQRPSCRNCAHSQQVTPSQSSNDIHPWRCVRGGFGVTSLAVCNQHSSAQEGAMA